MATPVKSNVWHGPVRLRVSAPGRISRDEAITLLRGPDVGAWLGPPTPDAPPGMRRFKVDLQLRPPDGGLSSTFHTPAYVDLGSTQQVGDGLRVEISWRSASLAPLFPVFSGWLKVGPDEVSVDGYYASPGAPIAQASDQALLRLAARGTARSLLRQLRSAVAMSRTPSTRRPPASTHRSGAH